MQNRLCGQHEENYYASWLPFVLNSPLFFSYMYILCMSTNSVTDSEEGELNINGCAVYVLAGFQSVNNPLGVCCT